MFEYFKLMYAAFFCYALLFVACSSNRAEPVECNNVNAIVTPKLVKSIKIPVDTIQYKHYYKSVFNGEEDLYLGLDKGRNAIDVFNISKETYMHSIHLPNDGSPGSIQISDFYIHNLDTIFLFDVQAYKLFLVDIYGVVKQQKLLRNKELYELHNSKKIYGIESWIARMYYDKYTKTILFSTDPYILAGNTGFFEQKFILPYSLKDSVFKQLVGINPPSFTLDFQTPSNDIGCYHIVNSFADSTLLISYLQSHSKQIFNWIKDSVAANICTKSNYLALEFKKYEDELSDTKKSYHYQIQNGSYDVAFYHPFEKNYYFIATHNQPLKNLEGKLNDGMSLNWSVIKFDSNFNEVGEAKFPPKIYVPYDVFPCKEGILISKENDLNPNDDENYLEFDIYVL